MEGKVRPKDRVLKHFTGAEDTKNPLLREARMQTERNMMYLNRNIPRHRKKILKRVDETKLELRDKLANGLVELTPEMAQTTFDCFPITAKHHEDMSATIRNLQEIAKAIPVPEVPTLAMMTLDERMYELVYQLSSFLDKKLFNPDHKCPFITVEAVLCSQLDLINEGLYEGISPEYHAALEELMQIFTELKKFCV